MRHIYLTKSIRLEQHGPHATYLVVEDVLLSFSFFLRERVDHILKENSQHSTPICYTKDHEKPGNYTKDPTILLQP